MENYLSAAECPCQFRLKRLGSYWMPILEHRSDVGYMALVGCRKLAEIKDKVLAAGGDGGAPVQINEVKLLHYLGRTVETFTLK